MKLLNRYLGLFGFFISVSASAQHICSAGGDHVGLVSAELLQKPIEIQSGIGGDSLSIKPVGMLINTPPEVMAYYRQGLSFLYLFNYVDAIRSFNMALRKKPDLLLAYLALARAYLQIDGTDQAKEALRLAKPWLSQSPDQEVAQKWFAAVNALTLFSSGGGSKDAVRTAVEALRNFAPDDAEVLAFYVFPFHFKLEPALAILKINPNHVGAHHYLEHIYEATGNYALAQQHGLEVIRFAPKAWHAQHMLGHTLPMTGNWQQAESQFALADALTRAWFKKEHANFEDDWHFPHNLELYGFVENKLNHKTKAEALFSEECSIRPFAFNCLSLLDFYLTNKGYEDASKTINRVYAVDLLTGKASEEVQALYGETLLGLGDVDKAKALDKKLGEVSVNQSRELRRLALHFILIMRSNPSSIATDSIARQVDLSLSGFSFDTWSAGLLVAERLAVESNANHLDALTDRLLKSIHRIDPDFKI